MFFFHCLVKKLRYVGDESGDDGICLAVMSGDLRIVTNSLGMILWLTSHINLKLQLHLYMNGI